MQRHQSPQFNKKDLSKIISHKAMKILLDLWLFSFNLDLRNACYKKMQRIKLRRDPKQYRWLIGSVN